jgi:hypothetical protein
MKRVYQILIFIFVLALPFASVAAQEANPADGGGIDLAYIGQLLQALILATVPVLAGAATRFFVERARLEKAKLGAEQQYALEMFVKIAVYAAEQLHLSNRIDSKFDYAVVQVQAWCERHGVNLDIGEIRAHIEAAVLTEFNLFAEPEPAG